MSLLVANQNPARAPKTAERSARVVSLNVLPRSGETATELCRRLATAAADRGATPLHLQVFGDCRASGAVTEALRRAFGRLDWPVTWVEGAACDGLLVAGFQLHAFTGAVDRIELNGRWVGTAFTDGGARQCLIGGLMPADLAGSRADQTRQTLDVLQTAMAAAQFALSDAVRTWFFLENILSWYDEFNRARTGVYGGVKFRTGSLPASTGVGGRNPSGGALALAVWGLRPVDPNSYAEEVASPLQCPAPAYGSAFSRAMELATNGGRRLLISGTASIEPGGKTAWAEDVRQQVRLTMDVVNAILASRQFTLSHLVRGTAYFRRPADAAVFSDWLAANRLSHLPLVFAQCDICRDDLLFELEAEAEA